MATLSTDRGGQFRVRERRAALDVSRNFTDETLAKQWKALVEAQVKHIKQLKIDFKHLPLTAEQIQRIEYDLKIDSTLREALVPKHYRVTMEVAITEYINDGRTPRSNKPVKDNAELTERLIFWMHKFGKDRELVTITKNDIEAKLAEKAKDKTYRYRGRGKSKKDARPVSDATVDRYLTALSSFWTWCTYQGYVSEHVPRLVRKREKFNANPNPIGYVAGDDFDINKIKIGVQKLFQTCEQWDALARQEKRIRFQYMKMAILFAVTTGRRRNEVVTLKWADIDTTNLKYSSRVKGGIVKTFDMTHELANALREHRKQQMADGNASVYVFPSPRDNTKCYRGMVSLFPMLVQQAGLPHHEFHDLRDTMATLMLNATNGNFALVAEALGQSSVGELQKRYARWFSGTIRQEISAAIPKEFWN